MKNHLFIIILITVMITHLSIKLYENHKYSKIIIAKELPANNTEENIEDIKIKFNISEQNKDCLKIAVLGEHSKSSDTEIESFIYWIINKSEEYNKSICDEYYSKMKGGAQKYSSATLDHLSRVILEAPYVHKRIENIIDNVINDYKPYKYEFLYKFDHYLTLDLAISKKAPRWHKEHLIKYFIIDNTIYTKYNWKSKSTLYYDLFNEFKLKKINIK